MNAPAARKELAELTRARILGGVAKLLAADEPFSFRALALHAEIPERTLYRYFETKEALFQAFWEDLNASFELPPATSLDGLKERARIAFAKFDEREPVVRAMLHDPHGKRTRVGDAPARRREFRAALSAELDLEALAPAEQKRLLASVQLLVSGAGWESMKDYWGLDGTQAAEAVGWAIDALVDRARADAKTKSRRKKS